MYYNQRNYPHIPYTHETKPNATVKSGGCGPVAISMVVEAYEGDGSFPPEMSAEFAMNCGARESTGTNMYTLAEATATEFGYEYKVTTSESDVAEWIKSGGIAIGHIAGDRAGYKAIFCTNGHYVVILDVTTDGRFVVWDPDYYNGKFTINNRASRVELHLPDVLVLQQDMAKDVNGRAYHLLRAKKEKDDPSDWAKSSVDKAVKKGVLIGDEHGNLHPKSPVTREQLCVILDRLGLLD